MSRDDRCWICGRPRGLAQRRESWGLNCSPVFVPDAETAVRLHREELEYWLARDPEMVWSMLAPLRGKNLACFCPHDRPCHADTLLELANIGHE